MTPEQLTTPSLEDEIDAHEDASVVGSVQRAIVRSMDAREVVRHLTRTYLDGYELRGMLISRLSELLDEDSSTSVVLREAVGEFLAVDESPLSYHQRQALDATIRRLVALLPPSDQFVLVPRLLSHRRKARRRVGTAIVAAHPRLAPPDMKQILLSAYEESRDPEMVTPLSRLEMDLTDVAPRLLSALDDVPDPQSTNRPLREQARVFERIVQSDLAQAIALADRYQTAFVYGAGRARYQAALPHVRDVLARTQEELRLLRVERRAQSVSSYIQWWWDHRDTLNACNERLRLTIWALGRLRARDALVALALRYGADSFEEGSQHEAPEG